MELENKYYQIKFNYYNDINNYIINIETTHIDEYKITLYNYLKYKSINYSIQYIHEINKEEYDKGSKFTNIEKLKCDCCDVEYLGWVDICCDGHMCGCYGKPTNPNICSEECYYALYNTKKVITKICLDSNSNIYKINIVYERKEYIKSKSILNNKYRIFLKTDIENPFDIKGDTNKIHFKDYIYAILDYGIAFTKNQKKPSKNAILKWFWYYHLDSIYVSYDYNYIVHKPYLNLHLQNGEVVVKYFDSNIEMMKYLLTIKNNYEYIIK